MSPFRASVYVSALALAGFTAALGPTGCGNGLKSTYVPADRFPAAYAQALCQSLQHCCAENSLPPQFPDPYDYNACTAGWKAYVQTFFDAPNSSALQNYDPKAATNCINLITAAGGIDCGPVPGSISDARDTCQTIFAGKKQPGQQCTSSAECAPQEGSIVRCLPLTGDAGGQLPLAYPADLGSGIGLLGAPVCVVLPLSDAGVPCSGVSEGGAGGTCPDPTTYCDPTSLTCLSQGDVGNPCDARVPSSCKDGAYCITSGPTANVCAATLPQGSPCATSAECDSTTLCDPASKTCVPRTAPLKACNVDADCQTGICDGTPKHCLTNVIATAAACTGKGAR